ncbi:DNA internalization-related competence protein ComEC/Rec2 [Staphylococcus canis]|uniref:DNA internalization-related competence protein ComEC/Rec2 n=1 Tax=Staphylococcus canis TaxID=2724942 RepID=A0ABS0TAL2_9STAP|nr:DNA internalization-related competence protein ComEC/Rec2 [Staphylococcus canis]MBI5975767.1 DNA internalization-related competence protein ComEC/Rec2 [Staphylococcus canis]
MAATALVGFYVEFNTNQLIAKDKNVEAIYDSSQMAQITFTFENIPLVKDQYYSSHINTNKGSFVLTAFDASKIIKPDATFILNHECVAKGKMKPSTKPGLPAYFTIKSLSSAQCYIKEPHWTAYIIYLKNIATERLLSTSLPHKEVIIALITGQSQFLNDNYRATIRGLGISHLFAISGTHVGIFTLMLRSFLKRTPIPLLFVNGLLITVLLCFLIFTGFTPSAERAIIMTIIAVVFSKWLYLASLHIFILTYMIISFIAPELHVHLGFQYSFAICFLLIFMQNSYLNTNFFKRLYLTSFLSILGTLAISYEHFNEFQWIGLISNLIFVPFYGIIVIPLSFLVVLIAIILPQLLFVFNLPFLIIEWCENILMRLFEPLTSLHIILSDIGEWGYLLLIVLIFLLLCLCSHHRYLTATCILFISILLISNIIVPHNDRMTMIDVGQGDSILFESRTGQTLMIDTGGQVEGGSFRKNNSNIAEKRIIPLLKKRGVKTLDYLVLTHDHQDHIGELMHLTQYAEIKNVIINPNRFNQEKLAEVIKLADVEGFHIQSYLNLKEIKIGQLRFQFLNGDVKNSDNPNEHSIVTLATFNSYHILLMGDATDANEALLLKRYQFPEIDILKVGHHGSKTSSSAPFLNSVHPKIALISAGKHNMYHLPHPDIIKRLQEMQIKTYNTADNHHISIDFDQHRYSITQENE